MEQDLRWVMDCDVVLRMPGESSGADIEVEYAKSLGLPVARSVVELLDLFQHNIAVRKLKDA